MTRLVADPPGRQGPGPMQGALVEALDLVLASRASGALPGERRAAGRGTGTELAQIRPYQVGDDVRRIDAAASARTGIPHVRDHVPERTLTTWILVDVSASMAFGTADRLKSDVADGVALVIGRLAVRRAGRVGLLTCGSPNPRQLAPHSGRAQLIALRRALSAGVAPDGYVPDGDALAAGLRRIGRLARGPIGMVQAAQALALLRGRNHAVAEDVADLAADVLRHRLVLTYDALGDGVQPDDLLDRILDTVGGIRAQEPVAA